MKVRLKRSETQILQLNAEALFQFHEGPIKAAPGTPFNYTTNLFQFHEGPIKASRKR